MDGFARESLGARGHTDLALSFDYRGWPKRLTGYERSGMEQAYIVWTAMDVRVRAAHMGMWLDEEQAGQVLQRVHDAGVLSIRQVEREIRSVDDGSS